MSIAVCMCIAYISEQFILPPIRISQIVLSFPFEIIKILAFHFNAFSCFCILFVWLLRWWLFLSLLSNTKCTPHIFLAMATKAAKWKQLQKKLIEWTWKDIDSSWIVASFLVWKWKIFHAKVKRSSTAYLGKRIRFVCIKNYVRSH